MTCYLSNTHKVKGSSLTKEDKAAAEASKHFILMIGHWNLENELQYPFCAVGAARGLHIIEN
jgi:hypothetical protein